MKKNQRDYLTKPVGGQNFEDLTTSEFAKRNLVKPESVRTRYCLTGSFHGIVPKKTLSGRLLWRIVQDTDVAEEAA